MDVSAVSPRPPPGPVYEPVDDEHQKSQSQERQDGPSHNKQHQRPQRRRSRAVDAGPPILAGAHHLVAAEVIHRIVRMKCIQGEIGQVVCRMLVPHDRGQLEGTRTTTTAHRWVVGIDSTALQRFCTGSLRTTEAGLTAAECVPAVPVKEAHAVFAWRVAYSMCIRAVIAHTPGAAGTRIRRHTHTVAPADVILRTSSPVTLPALNDALRGHLRCTRQLLGAVELLPSGVTETEVEQEARPVAAADVLIGGRAVVEGQGARDQQEDRNYIKRKHGLFPFRVTYADKYIAHFDQS